MGMIPVEEFEQHCINQHKCRDIGFEAEYEVYVYREIFITLNNHRVR